jgi:hypothetical protein
MTRSVIHYIERSESASMRQGDTSALVQEYPKPDEVKGHETLKAELRNTIFGARFWARCAPVHLSGERRTEYRRSRTGTGDSVRPHEDAKPKRDDVV